MPSYSAFVVHWRADAACFGSARARMRPLMPPFVLRCPPLRALNALLLRVDDDVGLSLLLCVQLTRWHAR